MMMRAAKEYGLPVSAEVCPHHFTLTSSDMIEGDANYKMNPPLRTGKDRTALLEALRDDVIEVISTDHAPHSEEEKSRSMLEAPFGIVGLETSVALTITELVDKGYLSMMELLEKMTVNPAKLYHLPQGRLQEGRPADLVIFDPEEEWTVKEYRSKAANSPFTGWKLKGKVKYTICDGIIVER